jgi:hypothetical protein
VLVATLERRNRIPEILEQKGVTAYRLASMVDMTEKAIYSLVNSKQIPPGTAYITLRKIADALGVSLDTLDGSNKKEE